MNKKEIILVNLPPGNDHTYENRGSIYPATGIMMIATILTNKGFPVSIIDGAVDPDYENKTIEKISDETAFVGFSIMTSQIVMAYELAGRVKHKNSGIPVVVGGSHPTLYGDQTVNNDYIDIAVINEGAKTVLEIMDYVEGKTSLEDIKGISYCDKDGKVKVNPSRGLDDAADIPNFDFSLIDVPTYLNAESVYEREINPDGKGEIKLMPILTGLGCCFRCAFCINVILERKYRTRSAESIVAEIKRLQSEYGANAFLFLDEDFCINKKRMKEFIRLVKKEDLKFTGRIWTRVSYFRSESFRNMISEMDEIGIKSIAMGAESGSQRMLDYICKDIKCEDITLAAEELAKGDITPRFSFIAGMEGEMKEETIATYKLCGKLLGMNPRTDIAGPFTFRYYPGSPIFQQMVEKYDIKLPGTIEEWKGVLNSDGSLMIDQQEWYWPGFFKYSESMNKYISLCVWNLNRPGTRNKLFTKMLKKLILWRISCGEHLFVIDYYLLRAMKKTKQFLSTLLHGAGTRKLKEEHSA